LKKLILISVGFISTLIFANPADSLKQYHLHPVRVVAESPQASIGRVGSIRLPENTIPISEALSASPGLSVTYGTRDESNLRIRGFRKNEVLVMIDGRPLNSGYWGNVDISKILIDDIAEIRIVKGPASSLYGAGTMGGVVNLISKKQDHILSLESNLSRNLVNSQRLSSSLSFGDFRYKFSLMRDERRPYHLSEDFSPTPFENGLLRNHCYQEAWHADLGSEWLLDDLHEMAFDAGLSYIPYKEIPSSVYSRETSIYEDWYRARASLSMDYFASLNSNLRSQLYFDTAGDTFERFRDQNHQVSDLRSRLYSLNIGIAPTFEYRGAGTLSLGTKTEFRRVNRKDDGPYPEWTDNHALVGSVFSQYQVELNEELSYTASLGLAFFGHSQSDIYRYFLEPGQALYWNHPGGSMSSLSYGRNSAIPTMRQLFSSQKGNPDLKASRAEKLELGHSRHLIKNLFLDASIYYNNVRDLIDLEQERYANIYHVQSYGGEISLSVQLAKIWELSTQYSYLDYFGNYTLSDSAGHSVQIQNAVQLPLGLRFKTYSAWTSKRQSLDNIDVFHTLPAYHTHDLSLAASYKNLETELTLSNVFDQDYQSEYGFPGKGRDYGIKIKYYLR
jgi:outer membrane cobalamin receptor